jgi:hypothetical protein
MYGMLEIADPRIAPLRRALAVWGLTADDVGVLSKNGTSTGANVRIQSSKTNNFLTNIYRKRTRHRSGTTSSRLSLVHLETLSQSWPRRVSSDMLKEDRGK